MGKIALISFLLICLLVLFTGVSIFSNNQSDPQGLAGDGSGGLGGVTGEIDSEEANCVSEKSFNKISPLVVASLNEKRPVYEAGATANGLPWDVLAALHFRETGLNDDRDNPFQVNGYSGGFDSRASTTAGEKFIGLAKGVYGIDIKGSPSEENLKLAYLAYNRGNMYKNAGLTPEVSPYVMNYIDEAHQDMRWPNNAIAEPESVRGQINRSLGAYAFLKNLRECAGSSGGSSGSVALPKDKGVCDFCKAKPLTITSEMNNVYGQPKVIILHYLALTGKSGGILSADRAWSYFENINKNGKEGDNKYVQFVVGQNGTIYQFLPETKQAAGAMGYNEVDGGITISIENEGHFEDGNPAHNYTSAQLSSNVKLVRYLMDKYKISKNDVISHKQADERAIARGTLKAIHRSDPGTKFMNAVLSKL